LKTLRFWLVNYKVESVVARCRRGASAVGEFSVLWGRGRREVSPLYIFTPHLEQTNTSHHVPNHESRRSEFKKTNKRREYTRVADPKDKDARLIKKSEVICKKRTQEVLKERGDNVIAYLGA
jgi:hypothetical protein